MGQTEGSCPLNLSVREEEPLLQLVKKAPQPQAMPKEASEALLNLIAKTGRDLEITRKTRKAGEADLSERLRRGNLETSRNFSPIAPEVNLTELHPIVFPNRDHFPFHHDQFHNPDLKCAGGSDTSVPWEAAKEEVGCGGGGGEGGRSQEEGEEGGEREHLQDLCQELYKGGGAGGNEGGGRGKTGEQKSRKRQHLPKPSGHHRGKGGTKSAKDEQPKEPKAYQWKFSNNWWWWSDTLRPNSTKSINAQIQNDTKHCIETGL